MIYFSVWGFPELKGKSWNEKRKISLDIYRKTGVFWKTSLLMVVSIAIAAFVLSEILAYGYGEDIALYLFIIFLIIPWVVGWLYIVNVQARTIAKKMFKG